tara:strand:- start:42 stop:737 length:696 start_codon:yes stop_codon:yes gene_type:complete
MQIRNKSFVFSVFLGTISAIGAIVLSIRVKRSESLRGEIGLSRWMHENTPQPIDFLGKLIDAPITDIGAPLLFIGISLLIFWRWGRYATVGVFMAGAMTGLTRLSDIVERPKPNSAFTFNTGFYNYRDGGYPSGHVVYAVMIFGMIAVLAQTNANYKIRKRIQVFMGLLILLNIWTRISELHHWPGDVLGAVLLSVPALLLVTWLHKLIPTTVVKSKSLNRFLFGGDSEKY